MLTIGQLAAYAGVTTRAVRHYHQIGLLPEPERDASGYRRYGAIAVVSLIKIRTLAAAGVPLSSIAELLQADAAAFGEAVQRIDGRLREIGASERIVQGERDGWILVAARWPELIREWMPDKLAQLEDPRLVRLYRLLSEIGDSDRGDDDPRLAEAADILADLLSQAYAAGERQAGDDELPFDLLDALAVESDPRMERMQQLMRERGWAGWSRLERLSTPGSD